MALMLVTGGDGWLQGRPEREGIQARFLPIPKNEGGCERLGGSMDRGEMAGGWCRGKERIPRWGMSAAAARRIPRN